MIYEKQINIDHKNHFSKLDEEFLKSTILNSKYEGFTYSNSKLYISTSTLTELEIIEIETIIATYFDGTIYAKSIVSDAMKFGEELIVEFASENVLLGITQAGKTKDVSDYLQNLDRYLRSGSLYEAKNEIQSLISNGLDVNLEPFINEERLSDFSSKIDSYLGD